MPLLVTRGSLIRGVILVNYVRYRPISLCLQAPVSDSLICTSSNLSALSIKFAAAQTLANPQELHQKHFSGSFANHFTTPVQEIPSPDPQMARLLLNDIPHQSLHSWKNEHFGSQHSQIMTVEAPSSGSKSKSFDNVHQGSMILLSTGKPAISESAPSCIGIPLALG